MILIPTLIAAVMSLIAAPIAGFRISRGMGGMISEGDTAIIMSVVLFFVFFFLFWMPAIAIAAALMSAKASAGQKARARFVFVLSLPMFVCSLTLLLLRWFR